MNQEPFPLHRVFNQCEAGFWFLIALVLVLGCRRRLPLPWRWLLPLAFAAFGVSDVIEVETGAWWRPWWLLVLKAACVLVFLVALRAHLRHVKAHGSPPAHTGPDPAVHPSSSLGPATNPRAGESGDRTGGGEPL